MVLGRAAAERGVMMRRRARRKNETLKDLFMPIHFHLAPMISSKCQFLLPLRLASRLQKPPSWAAATIQHEGQRRNDQHREGGDQHGFKWSCGSPFLAVISLAVAAVSPCTGRDVTEGRRKTVTAGQFVPGLPEFTRSQVGQHDTLAKRVWLTYKQGVYDITEFLPNHPGADNILMAAGSSVEPFWEVYSVHKNNEEVLELLEQCRIGNLCQADYQDNERRFAEEVKQLPEEGQRNALLSAVCQNPFNAETPLSLLAQSFITSNELFYVRNHLAVPHLDPDTYSLDIEGLGVPDQVQFSLSQLKALPKHTVTAVVQCGGNRRTDMNVAGKVTGLAWTSGAIGNAVWTGPRLLDVLQQAGVDLTHPDIRHIHFEGADYGADGSPYGASIPVGKGLNPWGDVILAYEMNGQPLPLDHGFPVRVIVPGVVGARNVKWLQRVVLSDEECQSHWQQNDYKVPNPSVRDNPDFSSLTAVQSMPVTSAICQPATGDTVTAHEGKILVKGYAYSGGGQRIIRVDVTADNGGTWVQARLDQQGESAEPRHWSWTLWSAWVPIAHGQTSVQIASKAVDSSHNVQPESYTGIWNIRGLMANAYSRVQVQVDGHAGGESDGRRGPA